MPDHYYILNDINIINCMIGAGYLTLFSLCLLSFIKASDLVTPEHQTGYRIIWAISAIIILLIMLSSLFDISKTLMDNIRITAIKQGWYSDRRSLQVTLITGICAMLFLIVVINEISVSGLFMDTRHVIRWLGFLCSFKLIKMISFHYIDLVMNIRVLGYKVDRWLELSIAIFILISFTRHFLTSLKGNHSDSDVISVRYI
jgi:hypothetical protein